MSADGWAEGWAEAVWYGARPGAVAARAALAPAAALFRAGVALRGRLYDAGVLRAHALAVPALGVGNLTVGGTGKTPVAAWAVAELAARGAHPAVVLRGVGGDEARVHARLNPGAPVVADPDRVRGAAEAARRGADVVVLDDAFQHRRASRDADVVLVAAETFGRGARLLPAGPFRVPLAALARAALVVVTRKSAPPSQAGEVAERLRSVVGATPVAIAHLAAASLVRWGVGTAGEGERDRVADLSALDGARVLAVAGVGAPDAFAAQLRAVGARVSLARFPDHHAYRASDVADLAARARDAEYVVTTLKDAVKLGPRWPSRPGALWYVTQRVTFEAGAAAVAEVLDALAAAARGVGARTAAVRPPLRTAPDPAPDRGPA